MMRHKIMSLVLFSTVAYSQQLLAEEANVCLYREGHSGTAAVEQFRKRKAEILGKYQPTNLGSEQDSAYVRIYEQGGRVFFQNELSVGTKVVPYKYELNTFDCENNRCSMSFKMLEHGANVHFIGTCAGLAVELTPEGNQMEIFAIEDYIDYRPKNVILKRQDLRPLEVRPLRQGN